MNGFLVGLGFQAPNVYYHTVSVSFHLPSGILFIFPSRYYYAIDLETYLALEVGDPHLHLPFKVGYSGERALPLRASPRGLSPSAAGHSRPVQLTR